MKAPDRSEYRGNILLKASTTWLGESAAEPSGSLRARGDGLDCLCRRHVLVQVLWVVARNLQGAQLGLGLIFAYLEPAFVANFPKC